MAFKAIPVDSSSVSGSHSDFPVYIKPSAMTGWGALTLAEAQSIRFYSDEAKTTELAREVVDGSPDEIWVKVPSLTTSTTIYADYDGVRSDYAVGATYGRNAVWVDYGGVWHLGETSGLAIDSSGKNNGTFDGTLPDSRTGKISNGQNFNGSSDKVQFVKSASLNPQEHTKQVWVRTSSSGSQQILLGLSGSSGGYVTAGITSTGLPFSNNGTNLRPTPIASTPVNDNEWHKVSGFYNGSFRGVYVDGVEEVSLEGTGSVTYASTANPAIGRFSSEQPVPDWFTGDLDEVRLRSDGVSENWELTEYNNQNDVASFWGTVTDVGPAPSVTTNATDQITDTTARFNGNVTDDGGATITERGFVYSTSPNPTLSDSNVQVSGTTGAYNVTETGLTPETTYYVRAYAINSEGTSYGDDDSFTTLSSVSLPTVITLPVTNIQETP